MSDWVGRELDGRYQIEHQLGEGGMGVVLRAKHKFTGVPVAIKILRAQLQLDASIQERFLREAQAPNAIGHPGIVKVLDAGRSQEGQLYMVMELLTGRSLRVPVHRCELMPDQITRITLELLGILGHAHGRGFVHRDLKPDNVFLSAPADEVKLLDFGIAKVLDDVRGGQTAAGALLGTPAYMAPEQLADARNVDARADLWAVGVMLYEMVTGRLPVPGTTPIEIMQALAARTLIPIRTCVPDVSRELEAFFGRALAHDPRLRFGAAAELAQALGGLALPGARGPAPSVAATASSFAVSATAAPGRGQTVASVAHAQTPGPVVAAPQPSSPRMPPAGGSKKLAIGLAVALGAIAILVIALVAAKSGETKKSAGSDELAGHDAGQPDQPERAPDDVDQPPDKPAKPAGPDHLRVGDAATCQRQCRDLARNCNTHLLTCARDCMRIPGTLSCLEKSQIDCTDGARCGGSLICPGADMRGTASCRTVANCQLGCTRDRDPIACGCRCVTQIDPKYFLELSQLNACAFRCNLQPACIEQQCAAQNLACR